MRSYWFAKKRLVMAQDSAIGHKFKFWFSVIAIIIFLIFIYFYEPFEKFLVSSIPAIHFENVIFWFASVIGIVGYAVAHWQSFKKNILSNVSEFDVGRLIFDTLQTAIFVAVIFCAGAIVQVVAILALQLTGQSSSPAGGIGGNLIAIFLLVLFALFFYLLHHVVRAFREGRQTRRVRPRSVTNS
jgi:hypothetical protein